MKLALAQMHIKWEDKKTNLARMRRMVELAQAELILFPEMSLTGFSMHTEKTAELCETIRCGERADSETLQAAAAIAQQYRCAIGIGWVRKNGERNENHYSIVAPSGEIWLDYIKIHPFSYSGEDLYFVGGTEIEIESLAGFQVGAAICYDLRFPEQFRKMTPAAELVVVPANWPAARAMHWNTLLPARAIENQFYVAGINCCGEMAGQYYAGDTALYAPDGTPVTPEREILMPDTDWKEEKIYVYEITKDVEVYRKDYPFLRDKKEV